MNKRLIPMRLRELSILFIACLVLTGRASAELCEGDNIAISDGVSISSVEALAEAGDSRAQAQLGEAYSRGYRVKHDIAKAFLWLEKSAAAGDSEGQYLLGVRLIERADQANSNDDYKMAAEWLQKSANQGCTSSLLHLGLLTKQGKGVPKNIEAGIGMITKAASSGIVLAQVTLGLILASGDGVKEDTKAGFEWIKRASDTGDSIAQIFLADLYLQGKGTEKNPELSVKLLKTVISKNDQQSPKAAYSLGWLYMEGKSVPEDKSKALELMILAANAHISDSEDRVRTLTDELPKQKLAYTCSVYMDPNIDKESSKEPIHVSVGEIVVVMRQFKTSLEVYFPNRQLVGFISSGCIS